MFWSEASFEGLQIRSHLHIVIMPSYLTLVSLVPRPCQTGVGCPGIPEEGQSRYIIGFHLCLGQSIRKQKGIENQGKQVYRRRHL